MAYLLLPSHHSFPCFFSFSSSPHFLVSEHGRSCDTSWVLEKCNRVLWNPPVWLDVLSLQAVVALTTGTMLAWVCPGTFFPSSSPAAPAMFQGAGAYLALLVPEESCNVISLSPSSWPRSLLLLSTCRRVCPRVKSCEIRVGDGKMLIHFSKASAAGVLLLNWGCWCSPAVAAPFCGHVQFILIHWGHTQETEPPWERCLLPARWCTWCGMWWREGRD